MVSSPAASCLPTKSFLKGMICFVLSFWKVRESELSRKTLRSQGKISCRLRLFSFLVFQVQDEGPFFIRDGLYAQSCFSEHRQVGKRTFNGNQVKKMNVSGFCTLNLGKPCARCDSPSIPEVECSVLVGGHTSRPPLTTWGFPCCSWGHSGHPSCRTGCGRRMPP